MRKLTCSLAAMVLAAASLAATSSAQVTTIDWGGSTGPQNWHDNGVWVGGVFPNDSLKKANLSVNLGAGLNVSLGTTDATVAGLVMGGTAGAVTTEISGSTGRLIFHNEDEDVLGEFEDADFDNSTDVTGRDFLIWQRGYGMTGQVNNGNGDANLSGVVDSVDLGIWQDQYGLGSGLFNIGTPSLETTGVVGAVNTISAPIHIVNQQLEIGGPRALSINGAITYEGDAMAAGASDSGLRAMNSDLTVTINNGLNFVNSDAGELVDFTINNNTEAQGTFVINAVMSGEGDIVLGRLGAGGGSLGTIQLNNNNTYHGSIRAGRGNLILGHNNALGKSDVLHNNGTPLDPLDDFFPLATYRQNGPLTTDGYNMISTEDNRVISNEIVFAQWQTITGANSIEFNGHLTQTNNRGLINMLPAGKVVKISGDLDIWEDDEVLERRFQIDGSGKTLITGTISDDDLGTTGQDRRITKTGTGVLVIDVAAGANNHSGPEVILMGNMHYANNGSLNASTNVSVGYSANIRSTGGAVGVDVHPAGQTLATNATFIGKIDPTSTGGLMLAASDAGVNINFSSAALNNVENMSLAAPETGITYTGTLTPNANQFRLGGGTGTLTLTNVLSGAARSMSVRNGGTVRLLGNNSYGGATVIESKYTQSNQVPGENIFINSLVNPTLEVNTLANGGSNSSIGSSSNVAANLLIQGSTLKYVGTGHTTDRLFTIGTAGATLDASGTGAVVFSNTGNAVSADAADITGTLDDFSGSPNIVYNVSNSRDVIIDMTISDPDPKNLATDFTQAPCNEPSGTNCIPALDAQTPPQPVVVTGVSDNGKEIGISANYGFIYKENTRLVLGTVARTLTLTGSNTQANILSPVISNSVKGGVVNVVKSGTCTWLLESLNTTTGTTTVNAGTLGGNGGVGGSLTVNTGGTFAPGGTGGSAIGDFSVASSFALNTGSVLAVQLGGTAPGTFDVLNVTGAATLSGALNISAVAFAPAMGNAFTVLTAAGGITDSGLTLTGLSGFTKSIVGNSLIITKTAALSALAAVPEPTGLVLIGLALACCGAVRRRTM